MKTLVSIDFLTVPTLRFRILYRFVVLAHDRRRIVHFAVMAHPTSEWTAHQLREAFPRDSAPRFVLRDRDRNFGSGPDATEFRADAHAARTPATSGTDRRHRKMIIYQAFIESELEVPRHLARRVHDLYFEPRYDESKPRTVWSLSNAFTSALKDLDPIPQFRATAKLGGFLEARFKPLFNGRLRCANLILTTHKDLGTIWAQQGSRGALKHDSACLPPSQSLGRITSNSRRICWAHGA